MKITAIDLYGDGGSILYVKSREDLGKLLSEWVAQDEAYLLEEIGEEEWLGISDFLKKRGVEFVEIEHIRAP